MKNNAQYEILMEYIINDVRYQLLRKDAKFYTAYNLNEEPRFDGDCWIGELPGEVTDVIEAAFTYRDFVERARKIGVSRHQRNFLRRTYAIKPREQP